MPLLLRKQSVHETEMQCILVCSSNFPATSSRTVQMTNAGSHQHHRQGQLLVQLM